MTDRAVAARHEDAFLGNLAGAQDEYDWLVENEAWTSLGWGSFAEWWQGRVQPVMRALSMRPTREIAAKVVEQVRAEEAALPPAQRRTQRELGELVGASEATVGRQVGTRSATASTVATPNLEPAPPAPTPEPQPDYSSLDAEMDAEMEGTEVRFRRNFSTAMRRATEVWSFDAERIAEVYAASYDADIERTFLREMRAFCDRVTEAHRRQQRAGLRVVNGGLA